MDHSTARVTEWNSEQMETSDIDSTFTHEDKTESLSKSENKMHNKEQGERSQYYKKLGEKISQYNEVLLFGPTDAKLELHNLLKADHHFDHIKIHVQQADKMTDNQMHALVRDYFTK